MITRLLKGFEVTLLVAILGYVLTHLEQLSNTQWILNNTHTIIRATTLDDDLIDANGRIQLLQKEVDSLKAVTSILGRGKDPRDSVRTIVGLRYWKDKRMIRYNLNR